MIVRIGLGHNFLFLGLTQKLLAPGKALAVVEKYDLAAVVPDDPVLAHITLFGLASLLLVTGSGPYAVDGWIQKRVSAARGHAATADA